MYFLKKKHMSSIIIFLMIFHNEPMEYSTFWMPYSFFFTALPKAQNSADLRLVYSMLDLGFFKSILKI